MSIEKQETTEASDRPSWGSLLRDALLTPGLVHDAYQRFHEYSVRNQLLVYSQCAARGIMLGPLGTFKHWQSLGRHVRRGEKALTLCIPVTIPAKKQADAERDEADDEPAAAARTVFVYRARWFVLAQTDGKPYEALVVPSWREETALPRLEITRVPFVHTDGNTQGYSHARTIAINPVAALPYKTLFHELAHVVLGHTGDGCSVSRAVRELEAECVALLCIESLGLPGSEYALRPGMGTD